MKKISRKLFIWSPFAFMILYIFHFQKVNSSISQPPAGYVKDPVSNMTCARSGCHSSYPFFTSVRANITIGTTQSNQVALNGFQYNTGTTYIMNFSVINPTNRSGFEMSALTSTNANAGTFAVTNANNTTRQLSGGIYYIGHKNANSTSTWSFNWTSPATNVGNITFYTAVNKSNNNNNASGDSIFHQTFVVTPAPFSANAGNDVTICTGSATSLLATAVNGSGTNSYAWSPSTNLSCNTCANPTASPTSTTTYTVTITSGGQTASDAVTVNTFSTAAPNINTTGTTVCPSSSVTLSSSGFSSYLWSTGSNSSSTSVSNGGTYLLTATDANGCRTTNSIIVQQGQTPTAFISSSAQYLCGGNNVVLSVGSFSTYNWSNAATTPTISVSQTGNYSVTVINATGCSASASINIQANAPPAVNVTASGALSFCAGGSVTLMANAGTNYSYKWSTGATSSSVNVTQSGAYIVTVYNPCDSAVSQIQNVTVTPVPSAQATPSGPLLLCSGSSQTLLANSSGLSYQWLRDGNIIAGENIDSLIINTNGNYAVVTSNGTCSDTSQIVAVSTAGTGNASVNISSTKNQICPGDMIVLDAGTGFTTYNWLPGNSVNQTLQITNAGT